MLRFARFRLPVNIVAPNELIVPQRRGFVTYNIPSIEYDNHQAARRAIADYIDYYRTERKPSALGYLTPKQFERLANGES